MILSLLDRASSAVYAAFRQSLFGRLFTAYPVENTAFSTGLIGSHLCGHVTRRDGWLARTHLAIARSFENSAVLGGFSRLGSYLLGCSMRFYGLFGTSLGLYIVLIYLIKRYALSLETANSLHLLIGCVLMTASLPMLLSRQPVSEALLGSAILRPLLLNVAGIPRELLENRRVPGGGRQNVAFILGMLFGALTYYIPSHLMLLGFAGAGAMLLIFSFPETGLLAMIALLPYLSVLSHPSIMLAGMVLLTTLSYLIKLLRGKRVLRLELLDAAVILFMFVFLCGGLVSFSGTGSLKTTAIYVCFMLAYFLVVNLFRTRAWLNRAAGVLLVSAAGAAIYGIYQNYFGLSEVKWIDQEMFKDIEGRVVSTFENPNMLANYLILLLPLAAAAFLCTKRGVVRLGLIGVCGAMGLCLIFTWSRGAWLGLLIGLFIFLLLWNRKTLSACFLGLFALPLAPLVLPQNILTRFSSIGNIADSSTSYRVSIWRASLRMIGDFFTSGIGVGESAFRQVYPLYSLSGIEAAPHSHNLFLQIQIELGLVGLLLFLCVLFLFAQSCFAYNGSSADRNSRIMAMGGFGGILAALAQGMTDYIWYNYRVFFVFWFVLALTSAYIRVGRTESSRNTAGHAAYADATCATLELPLAK